MASLVAQSGDDDAAAAGIIVREEKWFPSFKGYMESKKRAACLNQSRVLSTSIFHGVVLGSGFDFEDQPRFKRLKPMSSCIAIASGRNCGGREAAISLREAPNISSNPGVMNKNLGEEQQRAMMNSSAEQEIKRAEGLSSSSGASKPNSVVVDRQGSGSNNSDQSAAAVSSELTAAAADPRNQIVACIFCGCKTRFEDFNNGKAAQPRFRCRTCKKRFTHGGKLRPPRMALCKFNTLVN